MGGWKRQLRLLTRLDESLTDRVKANMPATLWYEDGEGNKWIPTEEDLKNAYGCPPDESFRYQVSQFPNTLRKNALKITLHSEVDACPHLPEFVRPTYGWIDGIEGRECILCGGTQVKKKVEPWPEKWNGDGSRPAFSTESSWSESLVLAMAQSGEFTLSQAILVAANACERCMNALAYDYGLSWGYPEGSESWLKSNTKCDFCREIG